MYTHALAPMSLLTESGPFQDFCTIDPFHWIWFKGEARTVLVVAEVPHEVSLGENTLGPLNR